MFCPGVYLKKGNNVIVKKYLVHKLEGKFLKLTPTQLKDNFLARLSLSDR